MDAGTYKHLIEFEKCEIVTDDIGNQTEQWILYSRCYAYMNGLSGKEYWEASATQQENTVEFVMRYNPSFDGMDSRKYRIVYRGRVFNVKSIDNIQFRNKTVKIRAVSDNES